MQAVGISRLRGCVVLLSYVTLDSDGELLEESSQLHSIISVEQYSDWTRYTLMRLEGGQDTLESVGVEILSDGALMLGTERFERHE